MTEEMEYDLDNRDSGTTWLWIKKDGKKIGYIEVRPKELVENARENEPEEEGAVRPEDLLDMNSNSYMDFEGMADGEVTTEACKKAYDTMIQGNEPEHCKEAFWNILMHLVYEVEDQADAELVDAFAMDAATVLYNLMTIRRFVACNEPRPDKE